MRARAAFVCHAGGRIHGGIGIDGRRGAERGDAGLLLDGHDGHGQRPGSGGRAGALSVAAPAPVIGPGAQSTLGHEEAGAGEQPHAKQIATVHQAGSDELLPVLECAVHLAPLGARNLLTFAVVVHSSPRTSARN